MWGKILGALFGLAILRLPGLFIGLLLGHWFDQALRQRFERRGGFQGLFHSHKEAQGVFMYSTFAVMGHLAKSTGVVTQAHIRQAQHFMTQLGLTVQQQKEAQNAFRDGKASAFPWQQQLADLKMAYLNRPDVLMLFMEIQMSIALVDGQLTRQQRQILTRIAELLDFSPLQFEQILGRYEAEARFQHRRHHGSHSAQRPQRSLADAYALLGTQEGCTDQQLKKAYKRQMAQHHPDKLVAQGMPPEMQELANQKTQEIQAAYELIKQQRGL
ncbi:co-chaperone DjlA [Alkalimonas collagenimarina]|uniref:Co-chaperone protein DjlA n=1 Tax=Alkalimonas collagenimarina TaxID=400390 RepID=A0ABT9GYQ8_9GAMM|nr:co-chaperone DjlA [Alkalimonas collagenimarina]MDP4536093.1 co-chaperone DjlA [Alkalimonas collagenimarina]